MAIRSALIVLITVFPMLLSGPRATTTPDVSQGEATGPAEPVRAPGLASISVTPDFAPLEVPAPTTDTVVFDFDVLEPVADDYDITCEPSGSVISCTPDQSVLYGGWLPAEGQPEEQISVEFTTSATGGTGTVLLRAKEQGCIKGCDFDTGFYNVTATPSDVPGPLSVDASMTPTDLQARSACVTSDAGAAAAFQCGELLAVHSMPAYRTLGRDRTLTLVYNSGTATPYPVVMADVWRESGVAQPDSFQVSLTVGQNTHTYSYPGSQLPAVGTPRRVAVGFDAVTAGLSTGVYDYDLTVRAFFGFFNYDEQTPGGQLLIVNRRSSPYGAGWAVAGVAELHADQPDDGLMLVGADGSAAYYTHQGAGSTIWIAPAGAYRDTIEEKTIQNPHPDSTNNVTLYERRLLDGTKIYFDLEGRQRWVTDRVGNLVQYTYVNSTGFQLDQIRIAPWPSDKRYGFAYASGKLDSVLDPRGRTLQVTVNGSGDLVDLLDPGFAATKKIAFAYNNHRIVGRTTRRGHTTRYGYHGATPLLAKDTLPGNASSPISITTFKPLASRGLAYAPSGNVSASAADAVIEIDGPRTDSADVAKFHVNRYGAPTTIVDPYGKATTIDYRSNAQLLPERIETPDSAVRKNSYDSRFRLVAAIDSTHSAGTDSIIYKYEDPNAPAAPSEISSPLTATQRVVQRFDYYTDGTLKEVLVGDTASRTTFTYASYGLVETITEHDVPTWNPATSTSSEVDQVTEFGYTPTTFNVDSVVFDGRTTTYQYDLAGNVEVYTRPGNRVTTYAYDLMNWPSSASIIVPSSNSLTTHFDYDDDGNRRLLTDPNNVTRAWVFHPRGMPETMTDEFGKVERYFYDAANNLTKTIDRQGDSVWTIYDRMNRPRTQRIGAVKIDNSSEHDTVYKDNLSNLLGDSTWVGQVLIPEDTTKYTYDVMGRAKRIENHAAIIVRTFNKEGVLSFDSTYLKFGSNPAKALRFTYQRSGARKTLQTKLRTYTYGYDAEDGSLQSIAYPSSTLLPGFNWSWPSGTVNYSWDNLGRVDSIHYPSGSWAKFRYDSGGRLAHLLAQSPTRVIADDEHTYNAADELFDLVEYEQFADPDLVDNDWGYDGAGRDTLFEARDGGGLIESAEFRYDLNGNREWEKKYPGSNGDSILNVLVSGSNRLASRDVYSGGLVASQKLYKYDHNGDQIREHWKWATYWVANDFYYDPAGRMIFQQPTNADCSSEPIPGQTPCQNKSPLLAVKLTTLYYYDGLGRRVGWNKEGGVESTFYDGDNVIEFNGTEFLQGPGTDNSVVAFLWPNFTCGSGVTTAEYITDGGRLVSYHGGTTGADCKSNPSWTAHGQHAGPIDDSRKFLLSRSPQSNAPEISFFRNRYYDAFSGRFLQEDPIGHAGGINLYGYAGNNPATLTDLFGLCPEEDRDEEGLCPGGLTVEQWEAVESAAEYLMRLTEGISDKPEFGQFILGTASGQGYPEPIIYGGGSNTQVVGTPWYGGNMPGTTPDEAVALVHTHPYGVLPGGGRVASTLLPSPADAVNARIRSVPVFTANRNGMRVVLPNGVIPRKTWPLGGRR